MKHNRLRNSKKKELLSSQSIPLYHQAEANRAQPARPAASSPRPRASSHAPPIAMTNTNTTEFVNNLFKTLKILKMLRSLIRSRKSKREWRGCLSNCQRSQSARYRGLDVTRLERCLPMTTLSLSNKYRIRHTLKCKHLRNPPSNHRVNRRQAVHSLIKSSLDLKRRVLQAVCIRLSGLMSRQR